MDEIKENLKITYAKNLSKINFNTTISVPIDANVNIKTILDINSYLFDEKVECVNGKAIISGKVGLKVLYIDTDNISNTLTDSQSFSESYLDSSITSDSYINISNAYILNSVLSNDGTLKINCEVNINPIMYLNLGLNNKADSFENMITKKSELKTSCISSIVNTSFAYTSNIETKDSISKILSHNAYFTCLSAEAKDDYAVVEGKLFSCLLFESNKNEEIQVKEIRDVFNIKMDVPISALKQDYQLDLSFSIDKSKENITTEVEDDNNIITILNSIKVCGVAIKEVSVDIVDDMYSTENEIELTTSAREYFKTITSQNLDETVGNEIVLTNEEPAIDDILSNLNIVPEITNTYIKDENVFVEGVITSHIAYIDENKDYKHKQTEVPFIINTKCPASALHCVNANVAVEDCKTKVKRGTIIELEYLLNVSVKVYVKDTKDIVDNISIGKNLDFSAYDYQIFIARPNETLWELCKRIKTSPENLALQNKDLPLVMNGGERIVIKR